MRFEHIVDTNVFAQAHRFYYPFDVVPGFWNWLDREHEKGTLCSTRLVFEEILNGKDNLVDWAKEREHSKWFESEESKIVQLSYIRVVEWVSNPQQNFSEPRQAEFLSGADPWIIAKAMSQNATVVTHEKLDLNTKKKIYIPVVCLGLGVAYTDIYSLMRKTGAKLELK